MVISVLQSLPEQHPARRATQKATQNLAQTTTLLSPLHSWLKSFNQDQLQGLAVVDTCPPPPWRPSPFAALLLDGSEDPLDYAKHYPLAQTSATRSN
jgi:hypothetical protein